jgi:hypothetical protein
MKKKTLALLKSSVNEKDVENAYRQAIREEQPSASFTSPHNTDGYAQWSSVDAKNQPVSVRLLLEAKYDIDLKSKVPMCSTLGQVLFYLKKFGSAGEVLPNVLLIGDKNECFVLSTDAVVKFLDLPIDWSVAPSTGSPELTRALVEGMNLLPYVYDTDGNLDFKAVLNKCETLAAGTVNRVRATTKNLDVIFTYWVDRVFNDKVLTQVEKVDVFLRCLFQPADVYLHPSKKGTLIVPNYPLGVRVNAEQYRSFFDHFQQGYKPSEIKAFYAQKDRLIEDDVRRRQGAFFTPTIWVNEAHKMIEKELGTNWREECIVWDCAAGTGNLTRDYDFNDLIISTAEKSDIEAITQQDYNANASIFQYDFLNDDALSPYVIGPNRIPASVDSQLKEAAKAGKRIVFFMNPPYAEDGVMGTGTETKKGVALTATNKEMNVLGRAARQLYAQFMFRCSKIAEQYGFEKKTVAVYSKPTFISSGSYKPFRDYWYSRFSFKDGMLFQASNFADVSGAWGISFTLWNEGKTDASLPLPVELKEFQDFTIITPGNKSLYNADGREASEWVETSQKTTGDTPKFSSGLKIQEKWSGGSSIGSLGILCSKGNNLVDSATGCMFLSGKPTDKGRRHFDLLPINWHRSTALYAARKLVAGNWMNDKDEYLKPDETIAGYQQWNDDAMVYSLLHNSNNCTAMRDVSYKSKSWRIKNNFFWKTLEASKDALDTVETPDLYKDACQDKQDSYLASILPSLNLSPEAKTVIDLLDALWTKSLPSRESYAAGKPELHLLAHDAGVYQLKHLWRELFPEEWKALQDAFKVLTEKLRPGVYVYGFLKE